MGWLFAVPGKLRRWLDRSQQWSRQIHESFLANHPVPAKLIGGGLHWFYAASTHPAFAVLLALLLVGFVISGVVTVIVSVSVFFAWLVAILWVAHSEPIKRLNILPRVVIVIGVGVLAAVMAESYVKWCLRNYAAHQPGTPQASNSDQALFERLRDLLRQEISKAESERPGGRGTALRPESNKQIHVEKPNIVLRFVGTKRFAVMIENDSSVLLREPKYWFAMYNLTKSTSAQLVTVPVYDVWWGLASPS